MSSLANQQQNLSFPGLLQVPGGITSTLQQVQDGNGNATGLSLSSAGASVTTSDTYQASKNGTTLTGALPRLISDGFGDYVNVIDFGAIGNGVADDTVAINATVNAVVANGGGTIFFPAGTYLITAPISQETGANEINFIGDGVGTTTIKTSSLATTNMLVIRNCSNFSIKNLTIDPNNSPSTGATPYFPCYIFNCTNFSIDNVQVLHYEYQGMTIADSAYFKVQNCKISRDTQETIETYALHISAQVAVQPNKALVEGNTFINAGLFFDGSYSQISNNIANGSCYGGGIVTSTTSAVGGLTPQQNIVTGNLCYNGHGVDFSTVAVQGLEIGSQYTTISNNICYNNAGQGITFFGLGSTVTNNICFNNGVAVYQPLTRAGITAAYASSTVNASFSVVSNNRCFDSSGATGKQEYGYTESNSLLSGMVLSGNNFQGNKLGQTIISGTVYPTCSYDGTNLQYNYSQGSFSVAAGGHYDVGISGGGVNLGDFVIASYDLDTNGLILTGYVYATNAIRVHFYNFTASPITVGAGTIRVKIFSPYK